MYKILLCLRYLKTRYIALASIISVMLGVATMIVVNSVMAGFSTEMRERIHGILADVIIETNSLDGAPDAEQQIALVEQAAGEYVEAMTATVEVYGMLSFQYAGQWITRPVTLIGIKPYGKARVGPLVDYLDSYNPIVEDGRQVRPALRSLDEPPGWTLTAAAREYREGWTERQRWIRDQFDSNQGALNHPLAGSTAANDAAANALAPAETAADAQQSPEKNDAAHVEARDKHDELPENPFSNVVLPEPVFTDGDASADDVDPVQPLKARAYVGIGLVSFTYEDEQTGAVKTQLMARPGDDIRISTVTAGRPPDPVHFYATVVDLFKSGMSEYDSNLIFCNLEALQEYRGMVDPTSGVRNITSIQIKLKDFDDADEVVSRLRAAFPPNLFSVRTWEQKQGPLLAAVEVESAILNVLLFLIITVAGFGILAIFFMIVVEKTRDIGILKALGASSRGVMSIFLSYGLALGVVGSGVGVALGLLIVRHINLIESWITWLTGRKVFDEKIYYFPEIPTSVHPGMVLAVALGAMTIAILASILPARRASRLRPVEALRYE